MAQQFRVERIAGEAVRWLFVNAIGRGVRIGPKGWSAIVPPEIAAEIERDPTLRAELAVSPSGHVDRVEEPPAPSAPPVVQDLPSAHEE